MATDESSSSFEQQLSEFANLSNEALLVLNSDINSECFRSVTNALAQIDGEHDLYLILNSPGGSIEIAFWIAKAIREKCRNFDVMVPDSAKSAATLIALTADRVLLGQLGELGPLDPQMPDPSGTGLRSPLQIVKGLEFLRNYYLESFDVTVFFLLDRVSMDVSRTMDRAVELLSPIADSLYRSIDYRELGEASRDLAVSEAYASEAMRRWSPLEEGVADSIVRQLVWEYPDHGHIIDVEEANRIGWSNVHYMSQQLEGLSGDAIRERPPYIKIFLPNAETDIESDKIDSPDGEKDENETGTSCDQ